MTYLKAKARSGTTSGCDSDNRGWINIHPASLWKSRTCGVTGTIIPIWIEWLKREISFEKHFCLRTHNDAPEESSAAALAQFDG